MICPNCPAQLTEDVRCPQCGALITALVFPANSAPPEIALPVPAQDGEASCFYHPGKRAVLPCDRCGRFLCALCNVDLVGQHCCPGCIEARRKTGELNLVTRRTLHSHLALALAWVPLLIWPMTIVTAPAALFLSIRHWRTPGSLVRRGRIRLYAATVLSALECGLWLWLIGFGVSRLV